MTLRRILMSICLLGLFTSSVFAQKTVRQANNVANSRILEASKVAVSSPASTQPATTAEALQNFKNDNPKARFYGSQFYQPEGPEDEAGSSMTAVYGTILSLGATPEESALNHLNDIRGALGAEIGNFVPEVKETGSILRGVLWNKKTEEYKFHVLRFNQFYNGVPVFRSGAGFLVRNSRNHPLVMSGFTVKDLAGSRIVIPGEKASPSVSNKMVANVNELMDFAPVERSVLSDLGAKPLEVKTSEERFVVFAGVNGDYGTPELAVEFVAERGSIKTLPDYHKYLVVASVATGEILHEETQICHCGVCMPVDVDGKVEGRATQGLNSLQCDPEGTVPLPYAEVSIGGTTVNADANGDFTIPNGGTGDVTVTSHLRGTWFEVFDQGNGGATPQLTLTVSPPGPANFLHNPAPSDEFMTANVNAYVESNIVRDFVLNYEPMFPTIWNQTGFDINTQVSGSCNAFYNGSSINFYAAGGGCNNTAFSDVVHHEYGHHLINVSGNGQGQMGEGSGDTVGVLIQDDPVLGQGFSSCGNGIRTANNNHQYPCSGGIHDCGQLISGCVWDTLTELKSSTGSNSQAIDIASELFLGMLIVRGQMTPGNSTIEPDITVIFLELDDDDNDIGNGTPHYAEIATGFGLHNMDAPPLELIDFVYPNGRPDLIPGDGTSVAFEVQVVQLGEQPAPGTGILHVDSGSGYQAYPMTESAPNVYQAVFPVLSCGTTVSYYVSAESTAGTEQFSPSDAPATSYSALVAETINSVYYDDGEANPGWIVSGDATDGAWNRGTPVGGGDRGDPANDGDGSGACWLTDNEDGNSDVDGGSTILTSNILDATGGAHDIPMIKYRRFYSNNFGADPNNDVFVVEISNDGGSSWVNLETVGPAGTESNGGWFEKSFRIEDFVTPTNNMRVRFNASDLGDGSVVEAGIDGLEIQMASCYTPGLAPLGRKLLDGVPVAGNFSDVGLSDDVDYVVDPTPTSNPFKQKIDMIVIGESPVASPTQFGLRVESAMTGGPAGDVVQTIELFNDTTGEWEVIDVSPTGNTDSVAIGMASGDLTRFIHPTTSEIIARISWISESFAGSTFFWFISLDENVWIIE